LERKQNFKTPERGLQMQGNWSLFILKIINSEKYVSGAEDLQGSNTLTPDKE